MNDLKQQICDALGVFWDDRALPVGPDGATIVDELVAPVESMTAVEVLTDLDAIVGKKIPNTVIQAGGYNTREEFIETLSARVLEFMAEAK